MSDFLKFIEEDIAAKKTLLSTMPTKTKTNIKKYNEKIDLFSTNYNEYKKHVKTYLVVKSKSFDIDIPKKNAEDLTDEIHRLEHIRFLLNPTNTFFEKMGFDNLLFDIKNYSDFNFEAMNEIINEFINKFELVGVNLSHDDFNYTYYVREYMLSFLEIRNMNTKDYNSLSKSFEKIYWENPEIIEHVELSFRKLIKKYRKKFETYITNLQKETMWKNNVASYKESTEKLKVAYAELERANKENISDIINLAKRGKIDITNFFKDNKVRELNYKSLMIETLDFNDSEANERFHKGIEKLRTNIEEYQKLCKFIPVFTEFKTAYGNDIVESGKNTSKGGTSNKLKVIEAKINDRESRLEKINKKTIIQEFGFFKRNKNISNKQHKVDSIVLAKELYNLYKVYDEERFKEKILTTVNNFVTIPELLHLYYSYDFFKKKVIKKVFKLSSYDDILKYSEEFDLFSMNPNNVIINGVSVFEENTISKIIINKYRLDNINISEESLEVDNLNTLLNQIQFILRANEIERSETTVEKIWFMVEVEKIIELEK